MQSYQLKVTKEIDSNGVIHQFSEAELTVKTWKSAPYGYGHNDWVPETVRVWIHEATGVLTVDPDAYVGHLSDRVS